VNDAWICEQCRTVFPGEIWRDQEMREGRRVLIARRCPQCGNGCLPKHIWDRQQLEAQIRDLEAQVHIVSAERDYWQQLKTIGLADYKP
jgi:hypothetical protein